MITRVFKLLLELIVVILGLLFYKFLDYVVDGVVAPIFKEIMPIIGSSRKKKTKQFISKTKKKKTKQFHSTTKKKKTKQFTSITQENNTTQLIAYEEIRPQATIDVTTANFRKANELGQVSEEIISQSNLKSATIIAATDNFPEANKLSEGSITRKKTTKQYPPITEKNKKTKEFSSKTEKKKAKQFLFGFFKKKPKQLTVWEGIASLSNFDFATIIAATDNFSEANKLGQGGFGSVYKGRLPDGQKIAVKRLSVISAQGEEEFRNEIVLLAKLQHRNVVSLFGCCLKGEEKLLIYEYVPNAGLDRFLFDPVKQATLDWESRYKIIGGIARGILYLHEDSRLRIIHRDLKPSNILLDEEKNPKISDFGLATLFEAYQTEEFTDRIVGTCGYMAPEYVLDGQYSVKSDVFSFGVLLLEILTGQKNSSFHQSHQRVDLTTYAWRKWSEGTGTALDLIDPTMKEFCSQSEAMRCIHIALLCIQEDVAARPTMSTIVLMLNSSSISLPAPLSPGYFCIRRMTSDLSTEFGSSQASEMDTYMGNLTPYSRNEACVYSINEVTITDLCPR